MSTALELGIARAKAESRPSIAHKQGRSIFTQHVHSKVHTIANTAQRTMYHMHTTSPSARAAEWTLSVVLDCVDCSAKCKRTEGCKGAKPDYQSLSWHAITKTILGAGKCGIIGNNELSKKGHRISVLLERSAHHVNQGFRILRFSRAIWNYREKCKRNETPLLQGTIA